MPFLVAGLVGALVAVLEQRQRMRARFTLKNRAWCWWLARIAAEAGISIVALILMRRFQITGWDEIWGWFTAGVAGPSIARLRAIDLGLGEGGRPIGVATLYKPARDFFESRIHKRSAEEQARWINFELLPAFERTEPPPALLADYVIDYLRAEPSGRLAEIDYVEDIRDGLQPDKVKRELIARHAVVLGAYRLLDRFCELTEKGP